MSIHDQIQADEEKLTGRLTDVFEEQFEEIFNEAPDYTVKPTRYGRLFLVDGIVFKVYTSRERRTFNRLVVLDKEGWRNFSRPADLGQLDLASFEEIDDIMQDDFGGRNRLYIEDDNIPGRIESGE